MGDTISAEQQRKNAARNLLPEITKLVELCEGLAGKDNPKHPGADPRLVEISNGIINKCSPIIDIISRGTQTRLDLAEQWREFKQEFQSHRYSLGRQPLMVCYLKLKAIQDGA